MAQQEVEASKKEQPKPELSGIERSIMPATRWLEQKLQQVPILQPPGSTEQSSEKSPQNNTLSLREAIEQAQQQFTGTVLSADRIVDKQELLFRIKILSPQGVVQLIDINGQRKQLTEKSNETSTD